MSEPPPGEIGYHRRQALRQLLWPALPRRGPGVLLVVRDLEEQEASWRQQLGDDDYERALRHWRMLAEIETNRVGVPEAMAARFERRWSRVHEEERAQLAARRCLRCGKDLTDVMGCYVFVEGKRVDALLCVEHGANGTNSLSVDEYERLRTAQPGHAG